LFLRDLLTATTYALTTSGAGGAAMSTDGRFVAFSRPTGNVYLWDTQAAANIYTNITSGVASVHVAVSPDGRRIAYDAGGSLHVADRLANTNYLIGPPGLRPAGSRTGLRFSGDGRFLTYSATPDNTAYRVFLYDIETSSNLVINANGGAPANDFSDSPDLSADGRFVVYRSMATNLTSSPDTNGVPDLLLYDRLTGSNTLLTTSGLTGAAADNRSLGPGFSADGRTLVFESWASDLTTQAVVRGGNIFAFALLYVSVTPGSSGQGPTLSWLAGPGETYRVQYKNKLDDADWQDLTVTIVNNGYEAKATDPAPGDSQRFYRVVAF
jgi:Tol biopolymer transport system component